MHRPIARALTAVSLAALVAAAAAPAYAKRSSRSEHRGGKKAVGEIVSFDAATLALNVDLAGDEDFAGTVDPDVQVKLDHRGNSKRSRSGHGNPSEGSLDDLVAGTPVLRMKVEDDVVTKIRLRPLADAAPVLPDEDPVGSGDEASGDDASGDDDAAGEVEDDADDVADDVEDAVDADEDEDSDAENPDDDESGDLEDALPPLPADLP